ncbi:uncharacterized protein LOC117101748 [Anneissia japonica]|uniref:uncharacterized protein LOC117101748 n=1 Tax=Anneissia japonica TaxID=1529436 RepID=UPI00142584AE|nr:uncharacterized protein LOC117101748 [Anneissia japonica]XP_033097680.1 uncharacterized protein LOC117101748 [Anneissia japonica]
MAHSLFDGSKHEDSDSNSERYRYVYSGLGLRSTESLYRSDDGLSRIPVEASDIDSNPRGMPQLFHRETSAVDMPVLPVGFSENGGLIYFRPPSSFAQRSTSNREYVEQLFEQNHWFSCREMFHADSLAPSRPVTSQRRIRCPYTNTTSYTSTLSIVSGSDTEESDFEENTETVSGSSSHLITSEYKSATGSDADDTQYLLQSGCSTNKLCRSANGPASYSRGPRKSSMTSARKQIHKKVSHVASHCSQGHSKNSHVARKTQHKQGRSDIFHPTVDRSLKTSRRKYDCLITYASDATTKRQLAAKYLIARGYNVMTDVSSSAIASYSTLKEKDVLKKLEKIFHKCDFVLCFLSEEYILRIIGKKTKHDQVHIRFFANLMEEEYKQNGKTNMRFLPIHMGSKYSKMNNIPKYLTSYPENKCRQFQELVREAFICQEQLTLEYCQEQLTELGE